MSLNEKQTRQQIINLRLASAGWDVNDRTQVIEELEILVTPSIVSDPQTSYQGLQFSDYVLLGKDGKALAVVEAKKTSKDAKVGREQAKQYCYNIQKQRGGELPFCFYTNGYDIYFWDLENYPPRKVHGFPSRDDLERFQYIRKNRKSLTTELISADIAGRDYQMRAIRMVMEGIEKKRRNFLLVMATGTGKTRTCIALVDALMRAGWIERTLFLVDRVALRGQALDAFKDHLPNEPRFPKIGEKEIVTDRRIYVSTYPGMLNIIRDEKNPLSPHFFDLIVIDESHRSIYNTYQEILDYFNTITLGLTATPTDIIDHNTFELFDCDDGVPTFAYTYDEAVDHIPPYLCEFEVMKISTKFQEDGISKRTITLEDQKKLILEGKDVEEINFEGTELEKRVTNRGTNALIVKEFMEECIKDDNGVLPGKSIFFCTTKAHARRIEEVFDKLYPEFNGELAKVIVSEDPRVHGKGGLLDQFKNKEFPRVAISVDMLDTGIDILELVNLVFAKPVYSYTKFWQMIGRGTRLLNDDKIRTWCTEKDVFLILDCWDNFEYFKLNPEGKRVKQTIPLPVRFVGFRIDKIEKAIELGAKEIAEKETKILKSQINELPKNSVIIMDAQSHFAQLNEPNFWNKLTPQKIEFLRNIIKPLFRSLSQVDFKSMRFEKDVLETSLAFLSKEDDKYELLKGNLIEWINKLPLSVNIVAKQKDLIQKSQTNFFWANITDEKMDELSQKLAPLMKYIDSRIAPLPLIELNLKDELRKKEIVEFSPAHSAVSIAKYKEIVEERILELTNSDTVLQKIKNGESVSEEEAEQLAKRLYDEYPNITLELLQRIYQNQKGKFIQFIKHILGIEILESFPEVVSKSMDQFIQEHGYLSARQLEFLDLLREYLIERGNIQKRDLIYAPFTLIHPNGIRGVFSPTEIDEIVSLTEKLVA
jgi:type I restriction enzyme R subunit